MDRFSGQTIRYGVVICLDTVSSAVMPERSADTANMEKNGRSGSPSYGVRNITMKPPRRNCTAVLNRSSQNRKTAIDFNGLPALQGKAVYGDNKTAPQYAGALFCLFQKSQDDVEQPERDKSHDQAAGEDAEKNCQYCFFYIYP